MRKNFGARKQASCQDGPRTAEQSAAMHSRRFPTALMLAILALMSLNVITVSTGLAVGLAAALLAVDLLAWRFVAAMFDRERLVTGRRG